MKQYIMAVLCTGILLGNLSSATGQSSMKAEGQLPSLIDIERAIEESGASWTAGETPVSKLPEQRRMLYGAPLDKTFEKISGSEQVWSFSGQPERFDWRGVDGHNWMSPVKNQGTCGSCVAFMTLGTVEGMANIYHNNPDLNLNLSEQHLFSCGGGSCENGLDKRDAFTYMINHGTPDESCFPYSANDLSCSWTCDNWQSRATQIACWGWTGGTSNVISPAVIKEKLMEGPLAVTFMVYGDFNSYSGGVYQHVTGGQEAGHGVVLVGWDDTTDPPSWICKNSWGPGWGVSGYFNIIMGENHCGIEEGAIFAVMGDLPSIQVSETFHDFGAVGIGDTAEWDLPVTNDGDADLIIHTVEFLYGEFGHRVSGFPYTIGPGQTPTLPLIFMPTATYIQAGIATLRTNDCLDPAIDIRLYGSGANLNIVTIEGSETCAYPGENASFSLELDNQHYQDIPCSRIDMTLCFDPDLISAIDLLPTGQTEDLDLFQWEESAPGTLQVTAMGESGAVIDAGTGPIATLLVTISPAGQFGQYSEITIEGLAVLDAGGDPVQTEIGDGYVGVYCRGDVNFDDSINVLDMIRTIHFILSIGDPPTDFELWASDCTGDEKIDVLDVLGIANALLGEAPCQP